MDILPTISTYSVITGTLIWQYVPYLGFWSNLLGGEIFGTEVIGESIASAAAPVAAASSLAVTGALALAPAVPLAVPGAAPIGLGLFSPGAGAVGGGLLPLGSSPVVLTALALVPAGLTAVAVFPPLASQLVPALTVIFSEAPVVIRYKIK